MSEGPRFAAFDQGQIPDIAVARDYESPIRGPLLQAGYRALLTVPLLQLQCLPIPLEEQKLPATRCANKEPEIQYQPPSTFAP